MLLAAQPEPVTSTVIPHPRHGGRQLAGGRSRTAHAAAGERGARPSQANLLQGPIVPRTEYARYWLQWRKAALLVWGLVVARPSAACTSISWRSRTRPSRRRSGRSTPDLPGESRIVNVRSQMTQHLKSLGQAPQDGVLLFPDRAGPGVCRGARPQARGAEGSTRPGAS